MTPRKPSYFKLFGPIAALLVILPSGAAGAGSAGPPDPRDEAVLSLRDLEGQPRDLEAYRGRIVVLNFWATWCLPCREEMPILAEARRKYGPRGVEVIAASTDDEDALEAVRRFVRRQEMDLPVWVGATVLDMRRFGLGDALPATAVIDREGTIAFRFKGIIEPEELSERIDHLLGDSPGPEPDPLVDDLQGHAGEADPPAPHDHDDDSGAPHRHGAGDDASLVPS